MNINDIVNTVNGKLITGVGDKQIKNIKIDSRLVKKGDLFIALQGKNQDGHDYINDVIKKNPSAIIVCKEIKIKTKISIIIVKDTYESLMQLGSFFRKKYSIPLIAITGSVGKTMTKELISELLETKYHVLKSENNYNNHIGLPLTLFKLNKNYDICVVEMGMNHQGEISRLSKMCEPNIGIITNIGTAHIGNLGSKKNIFKAKMEIFDGMHNGLLIVNGEDSFLKKIKYSNLIKCGNDLKPFDIQNHEKTSFKLKINNTIHTFTYNSPNVNLIMNFVLAIQLSLLFKINIEEIKEIIWNYKMPNNRMNIYMNKTTKIIDDCYNASLESVISSIEVLNKEKNNKIFIFGDILELGKFSRKIHKIIEKKLSKYKNIKVLLIGEATKKMKHKKYLHFNNLLELEAYLKTINLDYTTFLVKGSRKMHLENIIEYLRS